ncbi:DgyrCDS12076 [Dimorphilus gyrociliatus]|uniref:DgyrCDS12076 n=1 Tax=Dimorphilus gyrociliatus TaxID=2664684 RepID=A0A7I8W5I2_9ANNE|nr:DgyrCDS12076 [Dimorphilus gyrociliatus]
MDVSISNLKFFVYFSLAFLPSCDNLGLVKFLSTDKIVTEGEHIQLEVVKTGIAASRIIVAVEILGQNTHDFEGTSVVLTIPPGKESYTSNAHFIVKNDQFPEKDELFRFKLTVLNGDGKTVQPDILKVVIAANDNAFGVFSLSNTDTMLVVSELSEINRIPFNIKREAGDFENVTILLRIDELHGRKNSSEDIKLSNSIVFFTEGERSKQVYLEIIPDVIAENDEIYAVYLDQANQPSDVLNTTNIVLSHIPMTILISENDAPIRFSQLEYIFNEEEFKITVPIFLFRGLSIDGITRIGPIESPATVDYYIIPKSATLKTDFEGKNGTVQFSSGNTKSYFEINVLADEVPEKIETFLIYLTNPVGDVVLDIPHQVNATILSNDNPHGEIKLTDKSQLLIDEDKNISEYFILLSRSGGRFGKVLINWTIISDSEESVLSDFYSVNGSATFEEGEEERNVSIIVLLDSVPEEPESFTFCLIPDTITGGGKVETNPCRKIIILDSDDMYGVIKFNLDNSEIIMDKGVRNLRIAMTRDGANNGILEIDLVILEAYLKFGAYFNISIVKLNLNKVLRFGPYKTPKAEDSILIISVDRNYANGEIGFLDVNNTIVNEGDKIEIEINREGISPEIEVFWEILTKNRTSDVFPSSGVVNIENGMTSGVLILNILEDLEPENQEDLIISIIDVKPNDNQKLKINGTKKRIIIRENDNPGGMFEIGNVTKDKEEYKEGDSFLLSIIRSQSNIARICIKYEVPGGNEEFIGVPSVIVFEEGVSEVNKTIIVRNDDLPEITESFVLEISSFGQVGDINCPKATAVVFGERKSIEVSIKENDYARGILSFAPDHLHHILEESKNGTKMSVLIPVKRFFGRYGEVGVDWQIFPFENNTDIYPLTGNLVLSEGEGEAFIDIYSIDDEIPEKNISYNISLMNPKNGAVLGNLTQATIVIKGNDDLVHFQNTKFYANEGDNVTVAIIRDGLCDYEASVSYRTRDYTASSEKDYVKETGTIYFSVNECTKYIRIITKPDEIPENNESFFVNLFNPIGPVSLFGVEDLEIIIDANDNGNGIFAFALNHYFVEEGEISFIEINRDFSYHGRVYVKWEITYGKSEQKAFLNDSGIVLFKNDQRKAAAQVTAIADGMPEFSKNYFITLTDLYRMVNEKAIPASGYFNQSARNVTITVTKNDYPYGLFTINEDIHIDEDSVSDSTGNLTIIRTKGLSGLVTILWELHDPNHAGSSPSVQFLDLILFSDPQNCSKDYNEKGNNNGIQTPIVHLNHSCSLLIKEQTIPESLKMVTKDRDMTISFRIQIIRDGTFFRKLSSENDNEIYNLSINVKETKLIFENQLLMHEFIFKPSINYNKWYYFTIILKSSEMFFFQDGKLNDRQSLSAELSDNNGKFLIGDQYFEGFVQDFRIWDRSLTFYEIEDLYVSPVSAHFSPISGYITFEEQMKYQNISIHKKDNSIAEDEKVYIFKLLQLTSGTIDPSKSEVKVTALKSDLANGYFGFLDNHNIINIEEGQNISFTVSRLRGRFGSVYIFWSIVVNNTYDFVSNNGSILFEEGESEHKIDISSVNDSFPELTKKYTLKLERLSVNGGEEESYSGGNFDESRRSIQFEITESDYPFGLFQLSTRNIENMSLILQPFEKMKSVFVEEAWKVVTITIERISGLNDYVNIEWKTTDGTALSPFQYIGKAGTIKFAPFQKQYFIDIVLVDDDIPENSMNFFIEIKNPTNGAVINEEAAKIEIIIQSSDNPFGELILSNDKLNIYEGQEYTLKLYRINGTGEINVTWEINDDSKEFNQSYGVVYFGRDDSVKTIKLTANSDNLPEIEEIYELRIIHVSNGMIGKQRYSILKIYENDDPYGVFLIHPNVYMFEETAGIISFDVERRKGTFGTVVISFTIENSSKTEKYADEDDYTLFNKTLVFQPGIVMAKVFLSILDDDIPEERELIAIKMTAKLLVTTESDEERYNLTYKSQSSLRIYIIENDFYNGNFTLECKKTIKESYTFGEIAKIHRNGGKFGKIDVYYYIEHGSTEKDDFSLLNETKVTFLEGDVSKAIFLSIVDDSIPEGNEWFSLQIKVTSNSSTLNQPSECIIIIEESDFYRGVFQFEKQGDVSLIDKESNFHKIKIIRKGGLQSVIPVYWKIVSPKIKDIEVLPNTGTVNFLTGVTEEFLVISVIFKKFITKTIEIELSKAINATIKNGGERFYLTLLPSQSSFGLLKFDENQQKLYELASSSKQTIDIIRIGGLYMELEIFYEIKQTSVKDYLIDENKIESYFSQPKSGKLPMVGTVVDVKDQRTPKKSCSLICLLDKNCKSLDFNMETLQCTWYSSGDFDYVDDRKYYIHFRKNESLMQTLEKKIAKENEDFLPSSNSVQLKAWTSRVKIPIDILSDSLPEPDEMFTVEIKDVKSLNRNNTDKIFKTPFSKTIIIKNNDNYFGLYSINILLKEDSERFRHVKVSEDNENFVLVEIKKIGGSEFHSSVFLKVNTQLSNGDTNDIIFKDQNVFFAKNETSKIILVGIKDDDQPESEEKIVFVIVNPSDGGQIDRELNKVEIIIEMSDYPLGVFGFLSPGMKISQGKSIEIEIFREKFIKSAVQLQYKIINTNISKDYITTIESDIMFGMNQNISTISLVLAKLTRPTLDVTIKFELSSVDGLFNSSTMNGYVNPLRMYFLLQVLGANYPHGIFSFVHNSISIEENSKFYECSIKRSYGTFGKVGVYIDIIKKSSTAIEHEDFRLTNTLAVFDQGSTLETIKIDIFDDDIPEIREYFTLRIISVKVLDTLTNHTPLINDTEDIITINILQNDNAYGIFNFERTSLSVQETNSSFNIRVLRSRGLFNNVSVFCYSQGTRLDFEEFEKEKSITFEIFEDKDFKEGNESFFILMDNPTNGGELGNISSVLITIIDANNEFVVKFADRNDIVLKEITKSIFLKVVRKMVHSFKEYKFTVSNSKDKHSKDIKPNSGKITFKRNEAVQYIILDIIDDEEPEEDEIFFVNIYSNSLSTLYDKTKIIIRENDLLSDLDVYSEDDTIEITISKTNSYNISIPLNLVTIDGTAKHTKGLYTSIVPFQKISYDFEMNLVETISASGVSNYEISYPMGEEVYLTLSGENIDSQVFLWEEKEKSFLNLFLKNWENILFIYQKEKAYAFSLTENSTAIGLINKINSSSDMSFLDFTFKFEEMEDIKTFYMKVYDDNDAENSEYFFINLLSSDKSTLFTSKMIRIRENDDFNGVFSFHNNFLKVSVEENVQSFVDLTIIRERGSYGKCIVFWIFDDPTNTDIQPTSGMVEFEEGVTEGNISLSIINDNQLENVESFFIFLQRTVGGSRLGDKRYSLLQINANDMKYGRVRWKTDKVNAYENEELQLTLLREEGLTDDLNVRILSFIDIQDEYSAKPGADFFPIDDIYVIPSGVSQISIQVKIHNDLIAERNEQFYLKIFSVFPKNNPPKSSDPLIDSFSQICTITIVENDYPNGVVEFKERNVRMVKENEAFVRFPIIRRNNINNSSVIVSWKASTKTTVDFRPISDNLVFHPNENLKYANIFIIDDSEMEGKEVFELNLESNDNSLLIGENNKQVFYISDNDSPLNDIGFEKSTYVLSTNNANEDKSFHIPIKRQNAGESLSLVYKVSTTAVNDIKAPLTKRLSFNIGQTTKNVVLHVLNKKRYEEKDYVLEIIYLNDSDNFLPKNSKCQLILPPNIQSEVSVITKDVYVNEPSMTNSGTAAISIERFKNLLIPIQIEWSIIPNELNTFKKRNGVVKFEPNENRQVITLKPLDDSIPELEKSYLFLIKVAESYDETVKIVDNSAKVQFGDSDFPRGYFEFLNFKQNIISETVIDVKVARKKGTFGSVNVFIETISKSSDMEKIDRILPFLTNQKQASFYIHFNSSLRNGSFIHLRIHKTELLSHNKNNKELFEPPKIGFINHIYLYYTKISKVSIKFEVRNFYGSEGKILKIPIQISGDNYEDVIIHFDTKDISAERNIDYRLLTDTIIVRPTESKIFLLVEIIDDNIAEGQELFIINIRSASGAIPVEVNDNSTTVVINTSDFPYGHLEFIKPVIYEFENPSEDTSFTAGIGRNGHSKGSIKVFLQLQQIFENRYLDIKNVDDICFIERGGCSTKISLLWTNKEVNNKTFSLQIKKHGLQWEIEKNFRVIMSMIQSSEGGTLADYQTMYFLSIKVKKYLHPNGIVEFSGISLQKRLFEEANDFQIVSFPIYRSLGTIGDISIYWNIQQEGAKNNMEKNKKDFTQLSGSIQIKDGSRNGVIEIKIINDEVPEFREDFSINIVKIIGGAEISSQLNKSSFSIRANQHPYGLFGILPLEPSLEINKNTKLRTLNFVFYRYRGLSGEVRLVYTIEKDNDEKVYSIKFKENEDTQKISNEIEPSIREDRTKLIIEVTERYANSIVGIKVNESFDNEKRIKLQIFRNGFYGYLSVKWALFSSSKFLNGTDGTNIFIDGEESIELEISMQKESLVNLLCEVVISDVKLINSSGGVLIDERYKSVKIYPEGVIVVNQQQRLIKTSEDSGYVTIEMNRFFGNLGAIIVFFQTSDINTTKDVDYRAINDGKVVFAEKEVTKVVKVEILDDEEAELDEILTLTITQITCKTNLCMSSKDLSYSKILIEKNDNPYGVFSIQSEQTFVNEPSEITLKIIQHFNTKQRVDIRVRSIGGGESWLVPSSNSDKTIEKALEIRDMKKKSSAYEDYQVLDQLISFYPDDKMHTVKFYIQDDLLPESFEECFIYLSSENPAVAFANQNNSFKSYATITIKPNDMWNGIVGFEKLSFTYDEDSQSIIKIPIVRKNAFFEKLQVSWFVLPVNNELLKRKILSMKGTTQFEKLTNRTFIEIPFRNDKIPENETYFFVKIDKVGEGARINDKEDECKIIVLGNDYPNGFIQLVSTTENTIVKTSKSHIDLKIERKGFLGKRITFKLKTESPLNSIQLPESKVERAVNGEFQKIDKEFVFEPNMKEIAVNIKLNISTSKAKFFTVLLYELSNSASLGISEINVTIVNDDIYQIWIIFNDFKVYQATNVTAITSTTRQLINVAKSPLSNTSGDMMKALLKFLFSSLESNLWNDSLYQDIFETFCILLQSTRKDYLHGNSDFVNLLRDFLLLTFPTKEQQCSPIESQMECDTLKVVFGIKNISSLQDFRIQYTKSDYIKISSNTRDIDRRKCGSDLSGSNELKHYSNNCKDSDNDCEYISSIVKEKDELSNCNMDDLILALNSVNVFDNEVSLKEAKEAGKVDLRRISIADTKGSIRCTFNYVAQGGTNEKWRMTIVDDSERQSCLVERPDGNSYLFFQEFDLEIGGVESISAAIAYKNDLQPLDQEEYKIDFLMKRVSSQRQQFKSQLARLEIMRNLMENRGEL